LPAALFTIFALVIVSTGNVVSVNPAKLSPTDLRGSGVRLGSALLPFLLPVVVCLRHQRRPRDVAHGRAWSIN